MARSEHQLSLEFERLCDATGLPVSVPASYRSMRFMLTDSRFIEYRNHPDHRDAWNIGMARYLHDLGGMGAAW